MWEDRYRPPRLSAALADQLHHVDVATRSVWLRDGSSIQDEDVRLRAFRSTDDTIRLMIAQAQARGWSGLNMRGDEAFLRRATRLAVEAGMDMAGRDDAMDAIIQDERARMEPRPDDSVSSAATPGHGEAWSSGLSMPKTRAQGYYRTYKARPFANALTRQWERIYGKDSLPEELGPELRHVDLATRCVHLRDGAVVRDHGDRIESSATTGDAFRLVIAQARTKGWSGISIRGDETFVRLAVRIALEEDFQIEGRTPDIDAIITAEIRSCNADLEAEVAAASLEGADAGDDVGLRFGR